MITYDVELIGGDLPVRTRHLSGVELVAQRITARLRTFKGEWILDQRRGLPFLEWKQQKPPDLDAIRERVRLEIQRTPGVVRVISLEITFGSPIRISGVIAVEDRELNLRAELIAPGGNSQPLVTLSLV